MSVQHYKNGQLSIIAGAGGIGGGDGENSFTGTKAEVEQAIAAGQIKENWTVYITDDLEDIVNTPGSNNCDCKIEYITQEQYDALPEDKLTNDIEYRITDNNPATPSAKNMAYDGAVSGIEANNVQDAIDAVSSGLGRILWQNPNPNVEFAPQTINLTDDDYDYLIFIYRYSTAYNRSISDTVLKGDSLNLQTIWTGTGGFGVNQRVVNWVSNTQFDVLKCVGCLMSTIANKVEVEDNKNGAVVPYTIIGCKFGN